MTYLERVVALTPQTPEASTVPDPVGVKPLWKHKGMMLPPYIQHVAKALMRNGHSETDAIHMAVGIVKNWAKGHDGHGHKVHSDVRAAAAGNVGKWEETRAKAHAETAAKHAEKDDKHAGASAGQGSLDLLLEFAQTYASSYLPGAAPARSLTGQALRQAPSQTVSPSPPLPPGVSYPTPAELLGLSGQVGSLDNSSVIRGAATQCRTAAVQAGNKQYPDALRSLRAAQEGVRSAHQAFVGQNMPTINVYSATLNPAATAAAQKQMSDINDQRNRYRAAATAVASHIDRIRRAHYHGMYGGLAEARFTGESMSALDRVLQLAAGDDGVTGDMCMIYVQVPPDLLPPGIEVSEPGHVTVCYLGHISDQQYQDACERAHAVAKGMPPPHGAMGGLGLFDASPSSNGNMVAYIPVECHELHAAHALLGDLSASDHPEYRPHVTLAYLAPGVDAPAPVTSAKLCFEQLFIRRGNDVKAFAFSGHHRSHNPGGRRMDVPNSDIPMTALGKVLALAQGR